MDSSGRLHMPGFVGGTFEETGLKKPILPAAKAHGEIEPPESRQVRRQMERQAKKGQPVRA